LSLLISTRDEAGEPMTDEELHDELITLLLAKQQQQLLLPGLVDSSPSACAPNAAS